MSLRTISCNMDSRDDGTSGNVREGENLEVEFLEDFDSYLEDIKDRLTISRMVSDSVIRAMVNAVEQEASEKIAQKDLEIASLQKILNHYKVHPDENGSLGYQVMRKESFSSFSEVLQEHGSIRISLSCLKNVYKEHFKMLRKEVDKIKASSSMRRINSGSELVGLGGILEENVSKTWINIDKTFDSLKNTVDTSFKHMDDMVRLSDSSLWQWHLEREFQEEIEDMVIRNCIRSLKEEFERNLWEQNAQLHCNKSLNWLEKMKEISGLRQELDAISKSLSVPEIGQSTSLGTDHFHCKVSGNHLLSSSLWEGNGKHEESLITIPENLDVAQLKHMTKDELVNYFKIEMGKMKRDHDYMIHEMTEDYFSLKREYLRERSSSWPLRKDKEFDTLRKMIPDIILKLDNILVENEKNPAYSNNSESLDTLKNRLNSLLSENHQLRDLLTDKKKEVNRLLSQVSDAAEKISQQSLAEQGFSEVIRNLECAVEDAHIEASMNSDVYNCLLRELMAQVQCITKSDMKQDIIQEVYPILLREAASEAAQTSKCHCEDSNIELLIMQDLYGVIFREAIREAEDKLSDMNTKYVAEKDSRIALGTNLLERERVLRLEVAEKERLKQEILLLEALHEEREKLLQQSEDALANERKKFVLASQELNNLSDQLNQQQKEMLESCEKSEVLKSDLDESMKQIELYKLEINKLSHKLELTMKELTETNDEKSMLLAVNREKQNSLLKVEAKDKEHRKQMKSVVVLVEGLLKEVADFECRIAENITQNNLRLKSLNFLFNSLIEKVDLIKTKESMYKQRLERRCSDLHKAETEVDLLGDEVDTLLSLLEKIYIALDHYSPILQHYPGIIEILKLVRRELTGGLLV